MKYLPAYCRRMRRLTVGTFAFLTVLAASYAVAKTPPDFSNGIVGTGFVANGGSSTHEYKVLIDYRVHGRHRVELKFVERNNYDERDLSKKEDEETLMVNCSRRTYTSSIWLAENDNNYGLKHYQNGDAVSWDDASDKAYAHFGNGGMLPLYLKMVCDSL